MRVFGIATKAREAAAGCVIALLGAVLTMGAVVAILLLKEKEWMDWLKDIPLNKKRKGLKPIHKSLQETLQRYANAQASAA